MIAWLIVYTVVITCWLPVYWLCCVRAEPLPEYLPPPRFRGRFLTPVPAQRPSVCDCGASRRGGLRLPARARSPPSTRAAPSRREQVLSAPRPPAPRSARPRHHLPHGTCGSCSRQEAFALHNLAGNIEEKKQCTTGIHGSVSGHWSSLWP